MSVAFLILCLLAKLIVLINAHETLSCIDTSFGVCSLGSGMIAKVLLLVLSEIGIGPIRVFNVLDAFKQSGSAHIHFSNHCVLKDE